MSHQLVDCPVNFTIKIAILKMLKFALMPNKRFLLWSYSDTRYRKDWGL